ncbi:hypothetical protein [Bacillus sp. T33-2]|uniref:hypothetical protein n=1 Tax=Bacillus sp. T33-2 TaxID=2054168 RepID=UPI0015E09223|nr:hypothetical protein [Bacillus sp. T33-2]
MFDWDRDNIHHIFRHDIEPQEAEEVFMTRTDAFIMPMEGIKKLLAREKRAVF